MAFNNRLSGYQNNSKTVFCAVYDSSNNIMDLSDYTGIFYMSSIIPGSEVAIEKLASMDSSGMTFNLTPEDTSLAPGDYWYNIDISSNTDRYTVVSDRFNLLDHLKF
ncbi:MAG TPA: hypothetical protein PK122_04845 [Candidatus Paceibacterota bacterium]|nr:hypothetical protein [Candidatus Paceibacterota bacterium]